MLSVEGPFYSESAWSLLEITFAASSPIFTPGVSNPGPRDPVQCNSSNTPDPGTSQA